MRGTVLVAILVATMFGSAGWLPATPASASSWVQVTTDVVNVRETPYGAVIGQASNGQWFGIVGGPTPDNWYKIDYYGAHGFVLGIYLGVGSAPAAGAPAVTGTTPASVFAGRWVDVDRSSGLVTLWDNGAAVLQVWGAMSADQSELGFWATANGTYHVFAKEAGLHYTLYGRAWIRHYVGFDPARDNGFHSYSLESWGAYAYNYNAPTGGCVALDLWAAKYVYDFVTFGTRVEVHW